MISVSEHAPARIAQVKPNSGPQARRTDSPSGSRIGVRSREERLRQKAHRASYVPQGRTLHILDLENLCEGPYRIPECGDAVARSYRKVVGVGPTDHVVLGTNPNSLIPSVGLFLGCRFVTQSGPDGADLALLKVLEDVDWIAQRFHRVVIGSGDHCFISAVWRLTQRGVRVVVAAQKGCISRDLHTAATVTHLLRSGVQDASETNVKFPATLGIRVVGESCRTTSKAAIKSKLNGPCVRSDAWSVNRGRGRDKRNRRPQDLDREPQKVSPNLFDSIMLEGWADPDCEDVR
jgi:hypothetical protein